MFFLIIIILKNTKYDDQLLTRLILNVREYLRYSIVPTLRYTYDTRSLLKLLAELSS